MTNQPFFLPAMFIGLLSIPLIFSLVPQNRFYGFRTVRTLADEELWFRANRIGGGLFIFSSLAYLVFAKMYPMPDGHDQRLTHWLAHLFFFGAPLLASVACIFRYLRRL